ncbi:tRNA-dihydrouridine synthase [Gemmiger formicilis]|nr:tRNA-dihydrouridine synthase [Gemmiger formicilis]
MQLRNLSIPTGAVFAPMAGLTDAACRHLMADHGAAWTVSEMASAKALNFHDEKSLALLRDKHPTACTPSSCSARSRSRWPRQFCL